jgi:hypothetical protein
MGLKLMNFSTFKRDPWGRILLGSINKFFGGRRGGGGGVNRPFLYRKIELSFWGWSHDFLNKNALNSYY